MSAERQWAVLEFAGGRLGRPVYLCREGRDVLLVRLEAKIKKIPIVFGAELAQLKRLPDDMLNRVLDARIVFGPDTPLVEPEPTQQAML